ncbi:MAG: hypothetical protein DMG07_09650, partial [Acidobacteria bacterium]
MESGFHVGPWLVEPRLNTISLSGRETRVEPKVVEVLVCMARHAGDVVSRERLIEEVWGDTFVSDAALTRCIAELRKVFDDDVREPRVIQTIAKQGYRLIAPVSEARDEAPQPEAVAQRGMRLWLAAAAIGVAAGIAAGALVIWLYQPGTRGAPVLR